MQRGHLDRPAARPLAQRRRGTIKQPTAPALGGLRRGVCSADYSNASAPWHLSTLKRQPRRLARVILSDIELYHRERPKQGQTLDAEIEEGRKLFASRVTPDLLPLFGLVLSDRAQGSVNSPAAAGLFRRTCVKPDDSESAHTRPLDCRAFSGSAHARSRSCGAAPCRSISAHREGAHDASRASDRTSLRQTRRFKISPHPPPRLPRVSRGSAHARSCSCGAAPCRSTSANREGAHDASRASGRACCVKPDDSRSAHTRPLDCRAGSRGSADARSRSCGATLCRSTSAHREGAHDASRASDADRACAGSARRTASARHPHSRPDRTLLHSQAARDRGRRGRDSRRALLPRFLTEVRLAAAAVFSGIELVEDLATMLVASNRG